MLNLIDGLRKHDADCLVFVPQAGEFPTALAQRGVPYVIIPTFFWMIGFTGEESRLRMAARRVRNLLKRILYLVKYLPRYVREIKQWQPNVLYTNTTAIFEGAILAWWLDIPHIWHARELKDVHFKYDVGNAIFKFLFRRASAQVFVSHALKNALVGYYDPTKAHVVHNGLPISQQENNITKAKRDTYTFAMVGRLQPKKNQKAAIEAIASLKSNYPHVRLLLAGGAALPYMTLLRNLVNDYGVEDQVTFVGEVDDPYASVYSKADAYLMCSTNETFGRVTVEAMLAGLPVIGYRSEITGTQEIVEHEVTGLLYEGGAQALTKCMEKFIRDPAVAEELGRKGQEIARQKFSVETYVESIYRIIQQQVPL